MADSDTIVYDADGRPRHFSFGPGETGLTGGTAQETAKRFLAEHADLFKVPSEAMDKLETAGVACARRRGRKTLRFESQKQTDGLDRRQLQPDHVRSAHLSGRRLGRNARPAKPG